MIDVATAEPYGDYPALTVRAALAAFILPLAAGASVTIGPVKSLKGQVMPTQTVQVHIHQIAPPGWQIVTRTVAENQIVVRRLK